MGMIERVAAAIWLAEYDEELPPEGTISRAMVMQMARTAIGAMREPTPAMIAEAWAGITAAKNANRIVRLGPGPGASDVWQAMIDAALEPSSPAAGR